MAPRRSSSQFYGVTRMQKNGSTAILVDKTEALIVNLRIKFKAKILAISRRRSLTTYKKRISPLLTSMNRFRFVNGAAS